MGEYTPLRALCSPIADEIICVRVTRLWYHRGGSDEGPVKDIHLVLVDGQGDPLHAIVPDGFIHQFIDVLHEKNVYEISKFLLVKKQEVMRPVDAPFAIKITRATVVLLKGNSADALPEWSHSLTSFVSLPEPTVQPGCLIDVIGTICGVSDIQSFDLPQHNGVLIKRHVQLRDLSGHEIKIVLWGNSALRLNGDAIRALGQTESAVAIFVGTTTQEYDGERGLAGMAACSWYINEDIVDINIFHASLDRAVQPITHAPIPLLLSRRTQVGDDWPKKNVAQMAAFNFFENKDFKFRCTVTLSRVYPKRRWWYAACQLCRRLAMPTAADAHAYTCSNSSCQSTTANLVYFLTFIGCDQTGEADFKLFGNLAEQVIGGSIHQLIRNNQPAGPLIVNDAIAATRVRFPPPEVSRRFGDRYRFVVVVNRESFLKPRTSFTVQKVEAIFPRYRPLSSADTIVPATSWDIDTPKLEHAPSVQHSSASEPGPSDQFNHTPSAPDSYSKHVMEALDQAFAVAVQRADAFRKRTVQEKSQISEVTSAGGEITTLLGNNYKPSSAVAATNRKKRKLVLDEPRIRPTAHVKLGPRIPARGLPESLPVDPAISWTHMSSCVMCGFHVSVHCGRRGAVAVAVIRAGSLGRTVSDMATGRQSSAWRSARRRRGYGPYTVVVRVAAAEATPDTAPTGGSRLRPCPLCATPAPPVVYPGSFTSGRQLPPPSAPSARVLHPLLLSSSRHHCCTTEEP